MLHIEDIKMKQMQKFNDHRWWKVGQRNAKVHIGIEKYFSVCEIDTNESKSDIRS